MRFNSASNFILASLDATIKVLRADEKGLANAFAFDIDEYDLEERERKRKRRKKNQVCFARRNHNYISFN